MHLAFPRPGWDLLGWVALAPVLALAGSARTPRRALLEGWVAGVAFFLPLLRWLTHTMTTFSPMPMPVAILVILALAGVPRPFLGRSGVGAGLAPSAPGRVDLLARPGPVGDGGAPAHLPPRRVPVGTARLHSVVAAPRDPDRRLDGRLWRVRTAGAGQRRARVDRARAARAGRGRGARGRGGGADRHAPRGSRAPRAGRRADRPGRGGAGEHPAGREVGRRLQGGDAPHLRGAHPGRGAREPARRLAGGGGALVRRASSRSRCAG